MVSDMIMRSSKHSARRAVAFIALYGTAMSWILLPGLAAPSQTDSKKSNGTWTRKASIPTQRFEVGVTALDGKIYVLGGEAFGRPASGLNEEYDPATNRWRELAPIPHETSHVGAAGFNGKIYAIGGFTAVPEIGALDLAFEYDIAKDTWRKLPPLSSPRGSVGVAVVDGTVHVIGGRGLDRVTVATHEIYDPVTGHWTKGAPLPTARDHLGAVVFDGKIHIIGGRTSGSTDNTNFHDVYDPATDSWRSAAPLLTARSSGAGSLSWVHSVRRWRVQASEQRWRWRSLFRERSLRSEDRSMADAFARARWTSWIWRGFGRTVRLFCRRLARMRRRPEVGRNARFQSALRRQSFVEYIRADGKLGCLGRRD